MKDNLKKLLLTFLILPVFQIDIPEIPKIENKIPEKETRFATYSNPEMTNITSNFSAGQTVYLKADIDSTQEAGISLNLLDSNKNKILPIDAARDGRIITANFKTPDTAGIYYLHLEVKGSSLSFVGERNINVGDISNGDVKSETVVKNTVNNTSVSGMEDINNSPEIAAETPKSAAEAITVKNPILKFFSIFWDKLIVFFKRH